MKRKRKVGMWSSRSDIFSGKENEELRRKFLYIYSEV